jgi:hypothetical protein
VARPECARGRLRLGREARHKVAPESPKEHLHDVHPFRHRQADRGPLRRSDSRAADGASGRRCHHDRAAARCDRHRRVAQGAGLLRQRRLAHTDQRHASNQKWQKTDVAPGFATYKLVSSIGTSRELCLAASSSNPRPFAAVCDPSSFSQQWTRGFVNDGRILNRATFKTLTRMSNGTVEMRFLGDGQIGQNWHEHAA